MARKLCLMERRPLRWQRPKQGRGRVKKKDVVEPLQSFAIFWTMTCRIWLLAETCLELELLVQRNELLVAPRLERRVSLFEQLL